MSANPISTILSPLAVGGPVGALATLATDALRVRDASRERKHVLRLAKLADEHRRFELSLADDQHEREMEDRRHARETQLRERELQLEADRQKGAQREKDREQHYAEARHLEALVIRCLDLLVKHPDREDAIVAQMDRYQKQAENARAAAQSEAL